MSEVKMDQLLEQWWNMQQQLAELKTREMDLRKELFAYYFPNPKSGKNSYSLTDGFCLEAEYKVEPKMDFEEFTRLCDTPEFEAAGIHRSDVVEYKPEFRHTLFKKLTADKQDLIEQALTWRPAAPAMKIVRGKGEQR